MFETPDLFVADEASVSGGNWRRSDEWEKYAFEPGFIPLCVLCGMVVGRPYPAALTASPEGPLHYIDGPPEPDIDEGIQLSRIASETTSWLAALDSTRMHETVENWRQALEMIAWPAGDSDLHGALSLINLLADQAVTSGKSVYVHVLVR